MFHEKKVRYPRKDTLKKAPRQGFIHGQKDHRAPRDERTVSSKEHLEDCVTKVATHGQDVSGPTRRRSPFLQKHIVKGDHRVMRPIAEDIAEGSIAARAKSPESAQRMIPSEARTGDMSKGPKESPGVLRL